MIPSAKAVDRDCGYSSKSNLVRKPSEPSEKEIVGGTMRWKSHDAYKTVPSPPSCVVVSLEDSAV